MNDLPLTKRGLIRFDDVRAMGLESELGAALAADRIRRVRRGIYAPKPVGGSRSSEGERDALRYLTEVRAAAETLTRPVFTSFSALALAGLPVFGRWPTEIYVMSGDRQGHRRSGVVSVAGSYGPTLSTEASLVVTSLEFTLIQVCRTASLAAAVTAMDAALRVPRFGVGRARTTMAAVRAEHERLRPYRGSRRTDAVLARATSKADTPLETIGRLVIEELGFEEPALQHELWLPEFGRRAFLDFYWRSVDAGAEADGRGKYLARSNVPEAVAASIIAEKDRENAIRRQLRAFDRWDWSETLRRTPLQHRLTTMGVPRTRRRRAPLVGSPDSAAAIRPTPLRAAGS